MLDELRRDRRRELRRTLVSQRRREGRRLSRDCALLGSATGRLEIVEASQNRDGGSGRGVTDAAPDASRGRRNYQTRWIRQN